MKVLKLKFSSITTSSCPQRPQWLSQPKAVHLAETCHSHNCMLIRNDEPILIASITFSSMPLMPKLLELTGSLNHYSYTTFPNLSNSSSPAQPQIVSQKHFNTRWEKKPSKQQGGKNSSPPQYSHSQNGPRGPKNPPLHRPRQRHRARIE